MDEPIKLTDERSSAATDAISSQKPQRSHTTLDEPVITTIVSDAST